MTNSYSRGRVKIIILGQPATKKNSSTMAFGTGRAVILPSKSYKEYEKAFRQQLMCMGRLPHFETGVQVTAKYYLQNRAHYPDLVGLMQATADILSDEYKSINHKKVCMKQWILSDDRIIKSWDGTQIAGIDKENPRVEIEIRELETDLVTETDPNIVKILEARLCTSTTTISGQPKDG